MKLSEIIKLLKEKEHVTNSDLASGIFSVSNIYRFTQDSRELTLKELQLLSGRLSITIDELYYLAEESFLTELETTRQKINFYYTDPPSYKDEILKTYAELELTKKKSLGHFNLYFFCKVAYSDRFDTISSPNQKDLDDLYTIYSGLESTSLLTTTDYKLFANIITSYPYPKVEYFAKLLFPIPKNLNKLAVDYSFLAITNLITVLIVKEYDYKNANIYLDYLHNTLQIQNNYFYHIHYLYLKNILGYSETRELKYFNAAIAQIDILRSFSDNRRADSWQSQLIDIQNEIKEKDNDFSLKFDKTDNHLFLKDK